MGWSIKLKPVGIFGAALFVLPTPVVAFAMLEPKKSVGQRIFEQASGVDAIQKLAEHTNWMIIAGGAAATATLLGFILLILGIEIVQSERR